MAGFGIFRTYQKASMVALAILAMLAFFVLPPLLQYGGQAATVADTPVVTWNGGELRERGLERAMIMKSACNRFLAEAAMAAGRDPAQATRFEVDERSVVSVMLLAEEAKKNGIVVSDAAINDFLAKETSGQVGVDQFLQIMSGLRVGGSGVSQHDLFETLRQELLARNMVRLLQQGLVSSPPGLRWDYFRRLTQSATAEVVPIDVRSLGDQIKPPSVAALKAFFEAHKEDLPDPTSEKPGFREPHRAQVDYLVAKRGVFVEEISKEITDAEIAEYYEKNKTTQFRARPRATPAAEPASEDRPPSPDAEAPGTPAEPSAPADEAPATEPAAATPDPAASTPPASEPAPVNEPAAEPAPATDAAPAAEPAPAADPAPAAEPAPADKPADGSGAAVARSPFRQVAFQVPDAPAAETPPAAEAAPAAAEPAAAAETAPADAVPAETSAAGAAGAPAEGGDEQFQPLETVKEQIRERLARERAAAKVDLLFERVIADISGYNEDYALWKAREEARGIDPPVPPDVAKIASLNGLEGGQTGLQSAEDAYEAGGLGRSFDRVRDLNNRFGMRQVNWFEMIYGPGALNQRPVRSSDIEGNRYLSWRTADQPEFVPTFDTARANVEQAWKIVEGRELARKKAEAILAKAEKGGSLEAAIVGEESLQAFKVGPFFWLSPQAALSGVPQISQPTGIVMPGNEFMNAVFSLEPGGTAVAFNEPKTVCYCIRLIDVEPTAETLQERFIETRADPRTTFVAAQDELNRSLNGWFEGLESRSKLVWKRKPRR